MIEIDVLPAAWIMACAAVRAELSAVRIFCGMAGVTTWRCAFINPIDVTGCAGCPDMVAGQCEAGLAMIEVYILPITRVMTACAIVSHLSGMDIVMTGGAIRRRAFK